MAEPMPKIWWSNGSQGWFSQDNGGIYRLLGGLKVHTLPPDIDELQIAGEVEWGLSYGNGAPGLDTKDHVRRRVGYVREFAPQVEVHAWRRTIGRSEWEEVKDV